MTIIVTGGAGFIGSNFIYYELKNHPEDRVVCMDKLTYAGNLSTLEEALKNPNFVFYKVDICDRAAVYEIFEKERPDAVVNFAAESHVDRSIEDPEIFLRTNILGTQVMMDACPARGGRRPLADVRCHRSTGTGGGGALHHRHCGGGVLECRLCPYRPHYKLLRGYCETAR